MFSLHENEFSENFPENIVKINFQWESFKKLEIFSGKFSENFLKILEILRTLS